MTPSFHEISGRIERFLTTRGQTSIRQLGWGWDGVVSLGSRNTAIKGFKFSELYRRERDVYLRLAAHGVVDVLGFAVPEMIEFDDELMVVEMTIVSVPFVLDFAGARLDSPPDFPEDVLAEWEAEKEEQFGDDWPTVCSVMAAFQRFGIWLGDVHPGNIRLRNEQPST